MVEACCINDESLEEVLDGLEPKELEDIFKELVDLSISDQVVYRTFTCKLVNSISKLYPGFEVINDSELVMKNLVVVIKNNSFGEYIHSNDGLINSFINGRYTCNDSEKINITCVSNFYYLFRRMTAEKQNLVFNNINTLLNKITIA